MNSLSNILAGINNDDKAFKLLKNELTEKYDTNLVMSIISLPTMKYNLKDSFDILVAIIEDDNINVSVVRELCRILQHISPTLWHEIVPKIRNIIEHKFLFEFKRSEKLIFANTIEILYAKGYSDCISILIEIYNRISVEDFDFSQYSEEKIRIQLAKLAYSCHEYNCLENLDAIQTIKHQLKTSKCSHLMGMVYYYKGIAVKNSIGIIDYKDARYYISKSKSRGFDLAKVYISYLSYNSETSSEHKKARQSLAF